MGEYATEHTSSGRLLTRSVNQFSATLCEFSGIDSCQIGF